MLKPKQHRALAALLTGATDAESAVLARCTKQTIYLWRKDAEFSAEMARLLALQRERAQAIAFAQLERARVVIDEAMVAVDDDNQPAHGTRLRAAELVHHTFDALSRRGGDTQAPATGPLIVLPAGARPVALLIGPEMQGSGAAGGGNVGDVVDAQVTVHVPAALPAVSLETPGLDASSSRPVVPVVPVASPVPAGLPQWWNGSRARSQARPRAARAQDK
jgi:hypothetical protein